MSTTNTDEQIRVLSEQVKSLGDSMGQYLTEEQITELIYKIIKEEFS